MQLSYNSVIIDYDKLENAEQLKKRLLFWVFVYLTFHHFFFSIYVFQTDKIQSLVEGVSGLAVMTSVYLFQRSTSLIIPSIVLALYSFINISIGVWDNGGIYSSEISWYIITIFSIVIALNRIIGIVFYILTFATIVMMGFLQYVGQHDFTKNLINNGETYALYSCASVFVIIGIIIQFIFTTENIDSVWRKDKVQKIEKFEIEKANQLIQEHLNNLNFTKQLLETTEVERKRIATDLHDSISHELLGLKSMGQDDWQTVNHKIDHIINDIRRISRNLHPTMFEQIGLLPNLEQLLERVQIQHDFLVSTEIVYHSSLNTADELQIYRIIQEALTNIIKYADAYAAKITMMETQHDINIEIKDNGKGFEVTETLNGSHAFGLHNIIERSRVIGGEAKIQSSATGTTININIPKQS